jgi:hypothetical protein
VLGKLGKDNCIKIEMEMLHRLPVQPSIPLWGWATHQCSHIPTSPCLPLSETSLLGRSSGHPYSDWAWGIPTRTQLWASLLGLGSGHPYSDWARGIPTRTGLDYGASLLDSRIHLLKKKWNRHMLCDNYFLT